MIADTLSAIRYLFNLRRFGIKLDLLPTARALRACNSPQLAFPCIHIGGTNGKGSTSAMVASILDAHGLKTGLFTSPHLTRFAERISINGIIISDEDMVRLLNEVIKTRISLSFFETATVLALLYFKEQNVDIAVMEVGLGGRLDSTRWTQTSVSILTSVEHDHHLALTTHLEHIAWEKSGIFMPGKPAVIPVFPEIIRNTVLNRAHASDSPVFESGKDWSFRLKGATLCWSFSGFEVDFPPPLPGYYQAKNTGLALTAAAVHLGDSFNPEKAITGLCSMHWPGRFERIENFIIDGAHNPDAAESLAVSVMEKGLAPIPVIIGGMYDKDLKKVIKPLLSVAQGFHVTKIDSERAMDTFRLANIVQECGGKILSVSDDINFLVQDLRGKGTILVTGSFYLAGKVRGILLNLRDDSLFLTDPAL